VVADCTNPKGFAVFSLQKNRIIVKEKSVLPTGNVIFLTFASFLCQTAQFYTSMSKYTTMTVDFERQKNVQASLYTGGIAIGLLLLVWLVKFYQPVPPVAPQEEYIEINLGNSNIGSGNDQPELPGEPAPAQQVAYTPSQPVTHSSEESAKDIEENNEPEAPPVHRPTTSKPEAKNINTETKAVKSASTNDAPPTPPAPQPRAVMGQVRGGNGNGGNGAENYKPGTGEGQGGGPGDQGSIGGNPNGRSYKPTNFGVKMYPIGNQSFEDDFNQNAKVAMLVEVDANGKVTSATHTSKGSTGTATRNMISIAQRRAFQVKFPATGAPQKGTLIFDFSVR
jgi:periplasmic protein TonB